MSTSEPIYECLQVRRILRVASMLGMRARATGVGHSRSPLYVDEGNILMDVRKLQRHDGPRIELHQPVSHFLPLGLLSHFHPNLNRGGVVGAP